ncbi:uncharacterized protein LOC112515153 [Cynara cardunculus var. scolymus]|uniref:uncharacterized protein LOC112515153 n=1 Tax=Cynara cardunculus var. scolymus TaxID=59895 RepID=UPI000D62B010|nr:uncharacterized protein LOC112515153 [Cynara cardunculus var. scolymus]
MGIPAKVETERVEVNPQIPATSSKRGDIKMFLTCKPPTFSGERDHVKAMCCLKEIEYVFNTSKCPEEDKASIMCNKKMINIILLKRGPIVIYGDRQDHHTNLLSVLKAQKCIQKGCRGYLAYVINSKKEKGKQESIPIVCDYPEVSLEELTGLPPDRSIKFIIDPTPGTAPVARHRIVWHHWN